MAVKMSAKPSTVVMSRSPAEVRAERNAVIDEGPRKRHPLGGFVNKGWKYPHVDQEWRSRRRKRIVQMTGAELLAEYRAPPNDDLVLTEMQKMRRQDVWRQRNAATGESVS